MSRKRHRKEKMSRRERRLKSRVTLRTLFLLAITLIFNTYAWFLYLNTVSADITAHVDAWHVTFEVDHENVDKSFEFQVAHAYPGMTEQSKTVSIVNSGDRIADLTYSIKSARIFNDLYFSKEAVDKGEVAPTGAIILTEASLLTKLQTDYPFNITFTSSGDIIENGQNGSLTITFSWIYENNNDENDTLYGTMAYDYYQTNSSNDAIEIIVNIKATQHNEN